MLPREVCLLEYGEGNRGGRYRWLCQLPIHLDTALGGGTLLQRQAQGLGFYGYKKGGILGDKGGR
jgi:hypothetical protein